METNTVAAPCGPGCPMTDEPTLGELMRRFERFEKHVDSRFDKLVQLEIHTRDYDHLDGRVTALEERLRWGTRLWIGALLPIVFSALFLILTTRS